MTGAIDEELASDNPKGRLYARCQRLRFAAPTVSHRLVGSTHALRHAIEMTLVAGAWELSSGTHVARSRRAAEQLASRDLLAELVDVRRSRRGARLVGEQRLKQPEGAPLRVVRAPQGGAADHRASGPARWRARGAAVHGDGGSDEFLVPREAAHGRRAPTDGTRRPRPPQAHPAAAAELVVQLPEACAAELDPRGVLASLQQRGEIAHRFEVGERGPPSARVFTAVGHARTRSGAELVTESFEGTSKKAAIVAAARELVRLLRAPPR